jgi:hypothetical protein
MPDKKENPLLFVQPRGFYGSLFYERRAKNTMDEQKPCGTRKTPERYPQKDF